MKEYPAQIINIDEYVETLKSADFDRNVIAIENAIGDLPETYKSELINRLLTIYVQPDSSSVLTSNIEFVAPLLWKILPKPVKIQVTRRVDNEITRGNASTTEKAFVFVRMVGSQIYLSHMARRYKIAPLVRRLKDNLDEWKIENECVRELNQYATVIVEECVDDYVWGLTHTYVGYVGSSAYYSRTDFYANEAAVYISDMFQAFDDRMASAFTRTIRESNVVKRRIQHPSKIRRLRSLGNIVNEKVSEVFEESELLGALVDESREGEFFKMIGR